MKTPKNGHFWVIILVQKWAQKWAHFWTPFLAFLPPFHVDGSDLVVQEMAPKVVQKVVLGVSRTPREPQILGHPNFGTPHFVNLGGSKNGSFWDPFLDHFWVILGYLHI